MSGTLESSARAQLSAERDQLRRQLVDLGVLDFEGGFADSSQVAAEQGEVRVLAENLKALLAEVEHALEKLDTGDYGVCETCGEVIAGPRLEAMPATRYCVQHA